MKVSFGYNPLKEYGRLAYNLYSVESGFFKNSGMPLSYEYLKSPNVVVVPKFKELSSKDFWQKYKKIKGEIEKNYSSFLGDEFTGLFKEVSNLSIIETTKTEKDWDTVEEEFNLILNTLFKVDLKTVNVYLTHFGTVSSYNHKGTNLNIYLRKDSDISQIAFCILSYFIHKYKGSLTWREEQRAVDFLLLNTKIKKLFPKFVSILDSSQYTELDPAILLKSEQIYKDLGISTPSSIGIVEDKIFVLGNQITSFTKQEKLALQELVTNKNKITSLDQISLALWGNDYSDFSLQAISKTIERLRQKLFSAGLNRQVIITKRKQGYILYD